MQVLWWLLLAFAVMFIFTWVRIQAGLLSAEVKDLKLKQNRLQLELERLRAEVADLSSYGRIVEEAKKLGLEPLDKENIIELPER